MEDTSHKKGLHFKITFKEIASLGLSGAGFTYSLCLKASAVVSIGIIAK